MWSLDTKVAKRQNAIDQALLQAATGLRSDEANVITWQEHVQVAVNGRVWIRITEDIFKTGARSALVLDRRVGEHLLRRRDRMSAAGFVIGSPSNPHKSGDYGNRNKIARSFIYEEMAIELELPVFEVERSHFWRTTLHGLCRGGEVSDAVLDIQFGNSKRIRDRHYTNVTDLSALEQAAEQLGLDGDISGADPGAQPGE